MSSTRRSNARDSHIADYYRTPIPRIEEFLKAFLAIEGDIFTGNTILDPCAGGDGENPMSYPTALNTYLGISPNEITTIDIREDSLAEIKGDYLKADCKDKYKVIITNPPFDISAKIIDKALEDVQDGGYCIFLLRLNYFGGKLRKPLWDKIMPKYSFVHNRRISFTDNGKTDSIEYQHVVFQKGYTEKYTRLYVI